MKHFAFVVAMAAAIPGITAAQAADPADSALAVPPPSYRSVFQGLPAGVEEEQVDWKQANADVAKFPRGHADYVKWEEQQAGGQPAAGAASSAAPAPAPASAPASAPQGHRHH